MRRETVIAVGLVGAVVAIVAGWFLLRSTDQDIMPTAPAAIGPLEWDEPVTEELSQPEPKDQAPDWEAESLEPEVTRIIFEDQTSAASDIGEILSEKVLIDEEVVDESSLKQNKP